jgi:hypothetical protein
MGAVAGIRMGGNEMTFVEACWAGEAFADEIDNWIERWHNESRDKPLHEFLGLTIEQYERWINNPRELQSILEEFSTAE